MIIDCAKYSGCGGHNINEDSVFCGRDLFIVADGLGGHGNGSQASSAAVEYISSNYHGNISVEEITRILEGANAEVNSLDNGSRTTAAAAFFTDDSLRFANVGDSRVYYFRKNKIIAMTKDHSVCQASVDMGEMSFEDIRSNGDRSRLLKVLGNDPQLNLKKLYEPIEVMDGDAFIICSDGFWEYVHEREMEADLLKAENAEMWMRTMLKRHLLRSENNGDNYSVICGIIRSDKKPSEPVFDIPNTIAIDSPEKPAQSIRSTIMIAAVIIIFLAVVYLSLRFLGNSGEKPAGTNIPGNDEVTVQTENSDGLESDTSSDGFDEDPFSEPEETSVCETETDPPAKSATISATEKASETAVCETETSAQTKSEATTVTEKASETSVCETETAAQTKPETTAVTEKASETSVCETDTISQTETSEETSTNATTEISTDSTHGAIQSIPGNT